MYRGDDLPAGQRSATNVKKKKTRIKETVHSRAAAADVIWLQVVAECPL
jgi:hypothetical protein